MVSTCARRDDSGFERHPANVCLRRTRSNVGQVDVCPCPPVEHTPWARHIFRYIAATIVILAVSSVFRTIGHLRQTYPALYLYLGRRLPPWSVIDGSEAADPVLWGWRHIPEGHCEGSRPTDAREEEYLSRSGEPSYLPAPAAGGLRDGRAPAGRGPIPIEQPPSHTCGGWPAIPSNQRHQRSVNSF